MKQEYKIELTVLIDDANRQHAIDAARNEIQMPAKEFIETIDDALIELIQNHPAFEEARIEVQSITCTSEEGAAEFVESGAAGIDPSSARASTDLTLPDDASDELDRYDTGVYLCRWPNGDFSVVTADSKRDAIIALDEFGGAHPTQVHPMDSFMADFRLSDEGEIHLTQFGDDTHETVWDTCYPALRDLLATYEEVGIEGSDKSGALEHVRKAVVHERTRLWENQPVDEPATQLGRRIARHLGTSAVVADYYVEKRAKKILESDDDEDRKPN